MNEVQKIIIKHYAPKNKKFKTRGWEQCGNEIYSLIRQKEEKIKAKNLSYREECKRIHELHTKTEAEYFKYFGFYNHAGVMAGYDWINGNNKLKDLLANVSTI